MRILVTAGPTREFFDSVRFISNPSSGKMGYAIAADAARRAHDVTLISGPVDLAEPPGVKVIRVIGAAEMFHACVAAFGECQACVMTAAVCDYRPARPLAHKLRKQGRPRQLRLIPTRDILAHLGTVKESRVLVGFAMEDRDARRRAKSKLMRKGCDAIVLNGLGNVGADAAEVEFLRRGGEWTGPLRGTKGEIASAVMDLLEELAGRVKKTVPQTRAAGRTLA